MNDTNFLHFTFLFMVHLVIRSSVGESSSTELPVCFHIFLSTLTIFQSLKFRFKVQSSSSPSWVVRSSVVRSFERPNLGMTTATKLRESERWSPNLEYDPQHEKCINEIIIYEAVEFFFPAFSLSAFKFGVRSFDIQSLSAFGHSVFGHSVLGPYLALGPIRRSVIRRSVIRRPVFRRSVVRRSVIRRPVFRRSVGESL